jgi:hypothetical protein
MAKKKKNREFFEEDELEADLNQTEDDDGDDFPFDDDSEYEPEIDEDDIAELEEDYSTIKKSASSPCLRNGFCLKCDGDYTEPNGLCNCRCHDIA